MRAVAAAIAAGALAVSAAACSSSDPPDPAATMEEACAEARDAFAAAPTPVDEATDRAFLEAASSAYTIAYSPGFELKDDVENDALFRLVHYFGELPSLIGAHTALDVAYDARAIIPFLDQHAGELGVPACGADSWRLADYEAMTERLTEGADDEEAYVADVEAACSEAFGGSATPIADPTGVASIVTARASVVEFHRLLTAVVPPASLDEEHVALMAALAQFGVTVAEVERDPQPADIDERTSDALDAMAAAIEGLRLTC